MEISICGKEARRRGMSVAEREGQEILLCMQRDTSACANTGLDNFLHHHEDFSRWRTNADWMVLDIQAGVVCRQGLASGRGGEKKYISAATITPRNSNGADGAFSFHIVCVRSVDKP